MDQGPTGTGGITDPLFTSLPVATLFAVNVITIVFALAEKWDLGTMMFVYWAQSLIIGFFTVVRILSLRMADLPEPVRRSLANPGSRYRPDQFFRFGMIGVAGIFSLVYAFFHYGYFTFLADLGLLRSVGTSGNTELVLSIGLFGACHAVSFFYYRRREPVDERFMYDLFVGSFLRIIPMHLTLMAGVFVTMLFLAAGIDATPVLLVIFLGLKAYVDIRMHRAKHAGKKIPRSTAFGKWPGGS